MAPIDEELSYACIQDFIINNGDWDWKLLQSLVPTNILYNICSTFPPKEDASQDQPIWFENQGSFSVVSTYFAIMHNSWNEKQKCWSQIWRLEVP